MNITTRLVNTQMLEPSEWQSVYYEQLYNFARYKVEDEELIKDLIQDTFLAGMQGIDRFRQMSSQITWLTAILKYKIYYFNRCKRRYMLQYLDIENLNELCTDTYNQHWWPADVLTEKMDAKNFEKDMSAYLLTLPEKWQKLYQLKYLQEESTPEICRVLNLTDSNYWVLTHRLKKSLREWYLKRAA